MPPRSPGTVRPSTSSRTSPGLASPLLTRSCTARPTISAASSASLVARRALADHLPRRITVIRSAIAWTSLSLCEMNTIDLPPSRSSRMIRNRSSVSCGVSTAVGSSRISTLASRSSALMISTRCWTPTGRSSTTASGSTWRPYRSESSSTSRRARRRSSRPRPAGARSSPERDVLGHGEDRDQHEVLVHHADAGGDRVLGGADVHRLVVDQDLALVGLDQPVQDVHQGGLAGAVLAEQGVDLARAAPTRSMWSLATRRRSAW